MSTMELVIFIAEIFVRFLDEPSKPKIQGYYNTAMKSSLIFQRKKKYLSSTDLQQFTLLIAGGNFPVPMSPFIPWKQRVSRILKVK